MSKVKSQKSKPESLEEIELLKVQLTRALADYDNLRKRTESERLDLIRFASSQTIVKLLPVLDMLESAQKHLQDQGLAIAISEFKKVLVDEGLEEINPKPSVQFEPEIHEAIETIPLTEGVRHGDIAETTLPGWKFTNGSVVRAAKVRVYADEKKSGIDK